MLRFFYDAVCYLFVELNKPSSKFKKCHFCLFC